MPRTFSRFSAIAVLSILCLEGTPQAYPPRIDEKGRDLDQMAREDSLQRAAAVTRKKERLEKRRAYVRSILLDEPAHACVALLSRDRRCLLSCAGEITGRIGEACMRSQERFIALARH